MVLMARSVREGESLPFLCLPSLFINSKPIKCGAGLRLQHLNTWRFLHSHHFSSPLSGNQEVSAFGDGTNGDTGTCNVSLSLSHSCCLVITVQYVCVLHCVVGWFLFCYNYCSLKR